MTTGGGPSLIATASAIRWAPAVGVGAGWPELAAPSTAAGGPDLLAAVLAIGLSLVAAVTVVCVLVLRADRRRGDERKKKMDEETMGPIEIANRRARSRAQIRLADDPIVAGMELDTPDQRRGPRL